MTNDAKPAWSRRRLLSAAAAAGTAAVLPSSRALAELLASFPAAGIRFDVIRYGIVVGTHAVDFSQKNGRLEVRNAIDVVVSVLTVTLFEYRLHSLETYDGERLIAFESDTVDGDSKFWARGKATQDGFEISGRKGTVMAPADILVASYWTPRVLTRDVLIDPKRGMLKPQVVKGQERVSLTVGGQSVPATRYTVSGIMEGTVTYDAAGRWLGAVFLTKGSQITYRLRA